MSALTRRESRPLLDLFDWLDSPWFSFHPFTGQTMRVEDYVTDGHYVLRAELPGIDPEKDVEVTVAEGVLSIKAERQEEKADKTRSEFRYGSFHRQVTLPAGADEEHVAASYTNGILEVTIDLKDERAKTSARRIPVKLT